MATESSPLLPGTVAPGFALPDVRDGAVRTFDELAGSRGTIVVFTCNHCPYVKHVRAGVAAFARDFIPRGIAMVGIASNDDVRYPDDAPDAIARDADASGWTFPHVHDPDQTAARAYRAACTPEFYLFDGDRRLVYHGRFDGSRPGQGSASGMDLRSAAEALLAGTALPGTQHAAMGCGIKWRPGNEPAYR